MLVAAIAVAVALAAVGTTLGATLYPVPVALAFLLAVAHAGAIPLALKAPRTAAALGAVSVTALAFAQSTAAGSPWPWSITTMVAQAILVGLVGFTTRSRAGALGWFAAVAGTIIAALLFPKGTDAAAINIIIAGSVSAVALAAGVVAREWDSIRRQLVHERSVSAREQDLRMVAEEKARIARELHDVVAHSMSIIAVQASSAAFRHPDVPEPVAREFEEIARGARTAMTELRGVLGVLRQGDSEVPLAPQPTLADLPALVESTARSGVDVTLEFQDPQAAPVSDAVGLALYRAAQEALSNAIRHAPGTTIEVSCIVEGDAVVLSVRNSAPRVAPTNGEGGHGLQGMRERLHGVGGTLEAGPSPDGGFSIVARVPHRGRS